jgi:tetratricopeptide (TPR) repeat protein
MSSHIKTKITFIILFIILSPNAQDTYKISNLYKNKKYTEIIKSTDSIVRTGNASPEILYLTGRTYVDLKKPEAALPLLMRTLLSKDTLSKMITAWTYYYSGKAFAMTGNLDSANTYLNKAAETKAARKIVSAAKEDLVSLGLSPVYKDWTIIETDNFIFHFHNKSEVIDKNKFATEFQFAFDSINVFFQAELPKKIDFYVWNRFVELGKKKKIPAGFAIPELLIVHARYFQTRGHEMTHIISHYSVKTEYTSDFINEGTSTFFDLTNRNFLEIIQKENLKLKISIRDLWTNKKNFRTINPKSSYAIAGAFVGFLIENEGKEKYLKLLANQSYENAKKIYGDRIDELIAIFENTLQRS